MGSRGGPDVVEMSRVPRLFDADDDESSPPRGSGSSPGVDSTQRELPILDTFELSETDLESVVLKLSAIATDDFLFGTSEVASISINAKDLVPDVVTRLCLNPPRNRKFFPDSFAAIAAMDYSAPATQSSGTPSSGQRSPSASGRDPKDLGPKCFELSLVASRAGGDASHATAKAALPATFELGRRHGRDHRHRDRGPEAVAWKPPPAPRLSARLSAASLSIGVRSAARRRPEARAVATGAEYTCTSRMDQTHKNLKRHLKTRVSGSHKGRVQVFFSRVRKRCPDSRERTQERGATLEISREWDERARLEGLSLQGWRLFSCEREVRANPHVCHHPGASSTTSIKRARPSTPSRCIRARPRRPSTASP